MYGGYKYKVINYAQQGKTLSPQKNKKGRRIIIKEREKKSAAKVTFPLRSRQNGSHLMRLSSI